MYIRIVSVSYTFQEKLYTALEELSYKLTYCFLESRAAAAVLF